MTNIEQTVLEGLRSMEPDMVSINTFVTCITLDFAWNRVFSVQTKPNAVISKGVSNVRIQ